MPRVKVSFPVHHAWTSESLKPVVSTQISGVEVMLSMIDFLLLHCRNGRQSSALRERLTQHGESILEHPFFVLFFSFPYAGSHACIIQSSGTLFKSASTTSVEPQHSLPTAKLHGHTIT
jgi:hypothetical protein